MQQDEKATSGMSDKNYGLVSVLYHSLKGAQSCEQYISDASDDEELESFFEGVCEEHKQRAIKIQSLLATRIGAGEQESAQDGDTDMDVSAASKTASESRKSSKGASTESSIQ